jgi:hypothetical protein
MTCECGCGRAAAPEGRLSWACYKQRQRRGSTERTRAPPHPSLRAMVHEANINLNDTDPGDSTAWERAWARFRMATLRWRRKSRA